MWQILRQRFHLNLHHCEKNDNSFTIASIENNCGEPMEKGVRGRTQLAPTAFKEPKATVLRLDIKNNIAIYMVNL